MAVTDFGATADAGATPTDTGGDPAGAAPAAPVAEPAGRTYTQAEFDTHMAGLRRSQQAERERDIARAREQWDRDQASRQAPQGEPDPLDQRLGPVEQRVIRLDLDNTIREFQGQRPDFADKDTRVAVLEMAATLAEKYPELRSDFAELLDIAYWRVKGPKAASIDVKKIEEEAKVKGRDEYIAQMRGQSSRTPSPEGKGGAAPATKKKVLSDDDADNAALERIRAARSA